jgi:peptide/nickel transport system permease protein
MTKIRYIVTRVVQTVFLMWLVLTFLFFLFRLMPGSYSDIMIVRGADPAAIEAFEQKWGLNKPIYIQYWNYLANFVKLDIGTSLQYQIPVWEYVQPKIFNTFILAAPAITFAYIIGAILGTFAGTNRGTLFEKATAIGVIFFGSFPSFFISIVLIIVFASWLGLFPTSGMHSTAATNRFIGSEWYRIYFTTDFLSHYFLPFLAVNLRYLLQPVLVMRTSVVETLGSDHVFYHKMTGLKQRNLLTHIAKHSSLPVITIYPISLSRALGGLVLIETVFNWPGIGYTLVNAVLARDYPTVQFVFFIVAAFIIIANLAVDIIYGIIDPRVST